MSEDELKAIEARCHADTDADALRCVHGREPFDRCETCSGEDGVALVNEVRRLWVLLDRVIEDDHSIYLGLVRDDLLKELR